MIPTVAWMRQKFAEYNRKYFGGRIPMPAFKVCNLGNQWGNYDPNTDVNLFGKLIWDKNSNNHGIISLTNAASRTEKAVICTFLHEMCHAYVATVMGIWPRDQHGAAFMTAATNVTADGWVMEANTAETADDVFGGKDENEETSIVLCVIFKPQGDAYKYWVCKATEDTMAQFKATASKLQGVEQIAFFKKDFSAGMNGQQEGFNEQTHNPFTHVQSDPNTLFGWGGKTYEEALGHMARYCGVRAADFSFRNMQKIG